MRAAVLFIALASLIGCVGVENPPLVKEVVVSKGMDVERMIRSVPLVLYGGYAGSGVLFKDGDRIGMLTAAHLLCDMPDENDPKATYGTKTINVVGFKPSTETVEYGVQGKLVSIDPKHDWALLELTAEAEGMEFAIFRDCIPKIGSSVWAVGSPMFDAGTLSKGIVCHPDRRPAIAHDRTVRYIHSDAACSEGSSGGGLFDEEGICIGIVVRKHPDNGSLYAFSTYYIREDLNTTMLEPDLMPTFIE